MLLAANGQLVPLGGGDPIPLTRHIMTIGRRETCDICLRFANVSGRHCELSFVEGYWYVRDLNSKNGIKVNGVRLREKMLHPHDEISIAKRRYTIEYERPADRRALDEDLPQDMMGQTLLEKAGLSRRRSSAPSSRRIKPTQSAQFSDDLDDELDDED